MKKREIIIYKRKLGFMTPIARYDAKRYELVVSTSGVLTVRKENVRASVLVLKPEEYSKAICEE